MIREEEDEKEFEKWWQSEWPTEKITLLLASMSIDTAMLIRKNSKASWLEGRRTLREKIKADPSIGKLEVDEWPESPDY